MTTVWRPSAATTATASSQFIYHKGVKRGFLADGGFGRQRHYGDKNRLICVVGGFGRGHIKGENEGDTLIKSITSRYVQGVFPYVWRLPMRWCICTYLIGSIENWLKRRNFRAPFSMLHLDFLGICPDVSNWIEPYINRYSCFLRSLYWEFSFRFDEFVEVVYSIIFNWKFYAVGATFTLVPAASLWPFARIASDGSSGSFPSL